MQLIVKWINGADNVYTPEFAFDQNQVLPPTAQGQLVDVSSRCILRILFLRQVVGKDSLRFYRKLFSYHYNVSNLRSLVWDGLDIAWLDGSDARKLRTAHLFEDSFARCENAVSERTAAVRCHLGH